MRKLHVFWKVQYQNDTVFGKMGRKLEESYKFVNRSIKSIARHRIVDLFRNYNIEFIKRTNLSMLISPVSPNQRFLILQRNKHLLR